MKNQIIACFRALSSFNVITRETTCGWPATPRPPRKKAVIHNVAPNFKSEGNILTMAGSIPFNWSCKPEKPPVDFTAT